MPSGSRQEGAKGALSGRTVPSGRVTIRVRSDRPVEYVVNMGWLFSLFVT